MSNEHDHISIRVTRETDERIKQLRARMLTSAVEHVGLSTLKHGLSKGEVVRAAIEALEHLLDPPVAAVETKPKKTKKRKKLNKVIVGQTDVDSRAVAADREFYGPPIENKPKKRVKQTRGNEKINGD